MCRKTEEKMKAKKKVDNFLFFKYIGLGSLFDANQLAYVSKGDAAMETRVGEAILIRSLENMLNSINQDLENCESRSLAIISALATIIKVNFE